MRQFGKGLVDAVLCGATVAVLVTAFVVSLGLIAAIGVGFLGFVTTMWAAGMAAIVGIFAF